MRSIVLPSLIAAALAGCASDNPETRVTIGPADTPTAAAPPATVAASGSATPSAMAAAAPMIPPAPSTASAAPSNAAGMPTTPAFATRHAYYEETSFADLPGWRTDDLGNAWDAFRRSCGVLGTRSGWSAPCAASRSIDARNAAAIRQFFETYFNAYQIRNVDRSTDGTLTGYYEPLLNGSRQYGGAYLYPVYGTPDDILYLDARRVPASASGSTLAARIVGRMVIPTPDVSSSSSGGANGIYVLDLREGIADIRDKKYRLRLDHGRIVPYYTRAEIERSGLKAPVLAYVDDPVMLYSMQVQGSGKIRMRDGTIRRFAYAEQNGRPFLPPVANRPGGRRLAVRGLDMTIDVGDDDPAAATTPPLTAASATPSAEDDDAPASPLLRGFKLATTSPSTAGTVTSATGNAARLRPSPGTAAALASGKPPPPAAAPIRHSFATSDPSYVFFRPIADSPNGPVGALGVPLSAGRSIAVDPRTTPLGAPVFVSTGADPQAAGTINRLMMAQDSGGAIRGAVRADYFYGFGQTAQTQASRTKERLRMWVLLPKGLRIAAQDATTKTRGIGGPAASNADCLVSDPDLCVDDASSTAP